MFNVHFNLVFPVLQKCSKIKKGTIESAVSMTSVVHKRKKRKEKKVELIDDLENKYEAKIARLHEEAELPVSDIGAKKPKKRKKNQLQTIDDENHVEEKKTKLHTGTGKNIERFILKKIQEQTVKCLLTTRRNYKQRALLPKYKSYFLK